MRIVNVPLGNRSYRILIGRGLLPHLGAECSRLQLGRRCAIISDRNVAPRFAKAVQRSLQQAGFDSLLITVQAGETAKSLKTVQSCYDQLAKHRLVRSARRGQGRADENGREDSRRADAENDGLLGGRPT